MNQEIIPTEIRVMSRDQLEDELVRLRRAYFEKMAVFVNGEKAIDSANVEVNTRRRFVDVRSV